MANKKKNKSKGKVQKAQQPLQPCSSKGTPSPEPDHRRPSDLFNNSAFGGLLEQVLLELPLASIPCVALVSSSLRVRRRFWAALTAKLCKQANHVVCDSALIQLVLRRAYHRLPDLQVPLFSSPSGESTTRRLLTSIIDRERNLSALIPRETRCFHVNGGTVIDVQDGYVLMAVTLKPKLGPAVDPLLRGGYDGWSVWKLPDSMRANEQVSDPVGSQQYGLTEWSAMSPVPDPFVAIAFCPRDNAILVIRDEGEKDHPSLKRKAHVHRLYVYPMRPPPGAQLLAHDCKAFLGGESKHPSFPLPFIELISPVGHPSDSLQNVKICTTAGGRVGVAIQISQKRSVAGVWDWTSGTCLGTGENTSRIFDMAFLTSGWVMCSTMQQRDLEDDPGDWNFGIDDYGYCPCLDVFSICGEPFGPTHAAYNTKAKDDLMNAWVLGFKHEAMHMVVFHLPPLVDDDSADLVVDSFNFRCPTVTSPLVEYPSGTIAFALKGTRIDPEHPAGERKDFALQGCMPVGHALGLATLDLGAKTRLVKDETYRKMMYTGLVRSGLTRTQRQGWLQEAPVANIPWSARILGDVQELERPLYLPWSETQARVTFNDSLLPFVPATWGDRIIYLTACLQCCNEDPKFKVKCTGFGSGIVLQDFNPRTDPRLDRPLGGLSARSGAIPRAPSIHTRTRACAHPQLGKLPRIDQQSSSHLCDGRTSLASEHLFARGTEAFGMRNTTMSAHITWSHNLIRGMFMDQGQLVLSLDYGAVIMSF